MENDPVTDASVIDIRDITEISELRAVEDLQKEVWGCNDREILPSLALIPLLEIGGVLLGAFAGVEMVGFVLSLPGFERGRPILHSDIGTDRLWVTWELKTDRVMQRLEQGVNQQEPMRLASMPTLVRVGENNAPVCMEYARAESSVIEIPFWINSLVETDPALARRWRESTRAAFTGAIESGLVVEEFFRVEREGRSVGIYLLNKKPKGSSPI